MKRLLPFASCGSSALLGCLFCLFAFSNVQAQAPVNDDCLFAIPLIAGDTIGGTVAMATADTATNLICFDAESTEPGVWYSYTPATTGNIKITPCTISQPDVRVFSGDCANLTCVGGEDDSCDSGGIFFVPVDAGETYLILLNSVADTFRIVVEEVVAPANDACVDAIPVNVGEAVGGTNVNAAAEYDIAYDPNGNDCSAPSVGSDADRGVWYSFVAPAEPVNIIAMGEVEIEVSILEGPCDSLNCLDTAEDDDDGNEDGTASITNVELTSGQSYLVYVEGLNGTTGMFMVEACTNTLSCNDFTAYLDENGMAS
ncbi:MAG: hypothetical protein AAFU03_08310, partial [Bacteroidota bacterium]